MMPEWDNGYIDECYTFGVQTLNEMGIMDFAVYLFVDDTAFSCKSPEIMNKMLERYRVFVHKWRVRVNPNKCKVLEMNNNGHEYKFGNFVMKLERALKYLGYWLGSNGRDEHKGCTFEGQA